jgi:AsmA family protein
MNASPVTRRVLKGLLGTLAAVLLLLGVFVAALGLLDANHLRAPLIRSLASHTGREFRIDGPLQAHFLSLHPSFIAEHVTIGNPPWSPAGDMAEIDKLTVELELPSFSHALVIRKLELQGASLHLQRDAAGHANWHWQAPGILPGKGLPVIHGLSAPAVHLQVDDERRHIVFDGVLTAGAHEAPGSREAAESHDAAKSHVSAETPAVAEPHGAAATKDAVKAPGAATVADTDMASSLRISGKGHLNGHEVTLTLDGDPLATASRDKPYHFTLDERSSGSHLTGHVSLSQPFDFRFLDGTLEANGEDLKDLYFLVGVRLPDTGAFRVSGKIARRNTVTELTDLVATTGESDMHVSLKSKLDDSGRSHIDLDLNSQRLRLADLGARAAGRAPETPPDEKTALLPDTPLKLEGVRKSDYAVSFHAQHLDTGKLSFHTVVGKMTIDHGVVTVPRLAGMLIPLTAASVPAPGGAAPGKSTAPASTSSSPASNAPLAAASPGPSGATSAGLSGPASGVTPKDHPEGKITARIKFDAKTDTPTASIDLRVANIRLGQFSRKDPSQPPLDGLMQGRLDLTGRGRSLHDIASKADGTVTVLLPQGAIRASLAELTGLDFRGLGLMLTKNKEDTPIRCGVASFKAHDGTLTAQTLLIDTDPVLITGSGTIQLDTEALDLELQGHPKELRVLRLSAPFSVQGTLTHPSIGIEKGHRKLKLIDPGHAKDADCGTLLAQAKSGEAHAEDDSAPEERASAK